MGADISLFAEFQREDGSWQSIDPPDGSDVRCYYGLTMLAGVRDYGEGVPTFKQPSGIPEDSPQKATADEYYGYGGSSCTLAEMLAWPWDEEIVLTSWTHKPVDPGQCPNGFCHEQQPSAPHPYRRTTTPRKEVPHLDRLMKWMAGVASKKGISAQQIRLVFWFD